ncbi:MAG: hypothetical protein HYS43_00950 [Candidatus Liptonbacteria bacterium]|nr:hypothetical protein [Candidatus Liptonbacteria bacterium]
MAEARASAKGVVRTVVDTAVTWFGLNDIFKPFFKQERFDKIGEDSAKHRQELGHYVSELKPEVRQRLYRRFQEAGNRENRLVSVLGEFVRGLETRFVDGVNQPQQKERGRILIRQKLKEIAYLGDEEFKSFFEMLNNDWIRQWIMGLPGNAKDFLVEFDRVLKEGLQPLNKELKTWRQQRKQQRLAYAPRSRFGRRWAIILLAMIAMPTLISILVF